MSGPGSEVRGPAARVTFPLSAKLLAALGVVAVGMLLFQFVWFGPHATQSFQDRCDVLVDRSVDAMRELAREDTENGTQVLVDLIRHTSAARQRTLADLPLDLYRGDARRIRNAIKEQDLQRADRLRQNVDVLAAEMIDRADTRIEGFLGRLGREQRDLTATFAQDVRQSYLIMAGGVLAALLVLLGGGLYLVIVRPVRRLRGATDAVRGGDLSGDVSGNVAGVRSRDEVGALAADFGAMVGQLRTSRDEVEAAQNELQSWNQKLETEVSRKTEHLQRAQRQLVQAEKMASLGTLAGGVAHEFNNIIGGIRGCAMEALADEDDGERREPLEIIARAAQRGAAVTEQLLAFSRQRVGERQATDLVPVIDEVLELVEGDARRMGVRVHRQLPERLVAWADGGGLHQVVLNLVRNGLQAMPGGGELTVAGVMGDSQARITVGDTGSGIAPEHKDRVFEPFFTTKDREADPARRGSGLGLAVSYGILQAHGGRLSCTSALGEGTEFVVEVPTEEGTGAGNTGAGNTGAGNTGAETEERVDDA